MGASRSISSGTIMIEADRQHRAAAIQISHLDLIHRERHVLRPEGAYRVDLCITPRLAPRMRFDRWTANRYERPGRLFVVPPGETMAVWNAVGRESVIIAHLFTDAIGQWLDEPIGPDRDPIDNSADIASKGIERSMLRLAEEVSTPGFASNVMIEGLAMQIVVDLQRHYRDGPSATPSGGLAPWRLRRIDDRLTSSDAPASLSELAGICGLSARHLARAFRISRGLSIGHHVARLRMERAKMLLAGDPSVKSVAGRMGFSSTAAFCAAFRKATGISPAEYRRMTA